VPRSRFAPVKTSEDLLALWSDAYVLTDDMHVMLDPERNGTPVVIHLDKKYYRTYQDLELRFPRGAPSLVDCQSLKVEGDVVFGANVVIHGHVVFHHMAKGEQKTVPDGAEIRGKS